MCVYTHTHVCIYIYTHNIRIMYTAIMAIKQEITTTSPASIFELCCPMFSKFVFVSKVGSRKHKCINTHTADL